MYLSDSQLAAHYSVSRSTIWRWAKLPHFPKPVKIGPGVTRWAKSDVEKYDELVRRQTIKF